MHIKKTLGEPTNKLITPTAMKIIIKTFKTIGNLFAEHELSFNGSSSTILLMIELISESVILFPNCLSFFNIKSAF